MSIGKKGLWLDEEKRTDSCNHADGDRLLADGTVGGGSWSGSRFGAGWLAIASGLCTGCFA